ncbi:MAG: hypothetical protein IKA51_00695 [Clostridia bacterium]|nr:hypothetical protein [Clostridia bacterium]
MNKKIKILIIIFTVIICLSVWIIIANHGWKLGFTFCDSPFKYNTSTSVKVTEDSVTLTATIIPPNWEFKNDIIYKVEGNVLKVGVKGITLLDFILGHLGIAFNDLYNKEIPIPEGVVIDKVILCGGGDEKVIWTREEGNI